MRALIAVLVFVPLFVSAQGAPTSQIDALLRQIADLQAKVAAAKTSWSVVATSSVEISQKPMSCPTFARTLQRGSEGTDVRELQGILVGGGYLTAEATGYFGALTEKALQDFQKKTGIIASGSPAATGWGVLGPKSRAYILTLCSGLPAISPLTNTCLRAPAMPTETCAGTWQKLYGTNSCHSGWQCVPFTPSGGNIPPTLVSIDGPTTLAAGAIGAWTVKANDPEGGALKYSVLWGDEVAGSALSVLAGVGHPIYSTSPRFTHVYGKPGAYVFGITAYDDAGNTTSGRFSVSVAASPFTISTSTMTTVVLPTNGCLYEGVGYSEGTETEGVAVTNLCLPTNGVCLQRAAYIPKFKCTAGVWTEQLVNPYPDLPNYASVVGSRCGASGTTVRGATTQTVVGPATLMCRNSLCATTQNYSPVTLTCEYEIWIDWGVFGAGATTTSICGQQTPCEYTFGTNGRACAAKQNGVCPVPTAGIGR